MDTDKEIAAKFFTMMAMAGMKEEKGGIYRYTPKGYENPLNLISKVQEIDDVTIQALGGKKIMALKLLRHCEIATWGCKGDAERFGIISQSMFAVVARWPILRSYYEQCKIGSSVHTYARHTKRE